MKPRVKIINHVGGRRIVAAATKGRDTKNAKPRIKVINHRPKGRDSVSKVQYDAEGELDYSKVVRWSGGVELVEGHLSDEGKWAVYGPGGWKQFTNKTAAEKRFRELSNQYGR